MIKKLPFPRFALNTDIKIVQTSKTEDGGESERALYEGKAIYKQRDRTILDEHKREIVLTGQAIVEGDINPGEEISGFILVDGMKKTIYNTARIRNPDGSIFSTEVNLK